MLLDKLMRVKKLLPFLGLIALSNVCSGQNDSHGYDTSKVTLDKKITDFAWSIKAGYIYQAGHLAEIGVLRQKYHQDLYYHTGQMFGTSGPSIACELNFDKKILGPKIASEVHTMFVTAKANLIYYTDFSESSLCLTPELGISLFGFIVLSSRYCIPFYNKELLFNDSFDAIGAVITINYPIKFRTATIRELRKRDE
jgi:hypothetical protein